MENTHENSHAMANRNFSMKEWFLPRLQSKGGLGSLYEQYDLVLAPPASHSSVFKELKTMNIPQS